MTTNPGVSMSTIDMTGASDAEFEARIAPFEADEVEPAAVETVARAMWEADCGAVSYEWSDVSEGGRSKWRRLATAAIAALPPSPAEEAVTAARREQQLWDRRRVEDYAAVVGVELSPGDDTIAAVDELYRAALASPAPAPQDGVR